MLETEIILGLLLAIAALAWLASRLRVPYPILMVVGGLGISFIPHLPDLPLQPERVFLLFLPPILYFAATNTSWREFKANLRPIGSLAVGLVLFTMLAVALAAHLLVGMSWAPAFVLGAIVSPPDAVAATAIFRRLRVPRRIETILEGESLVNDATALVCYQFAVAAVVTGSFSPLAAAGQFIVSAAGGIGIGLIAGMLVVWIRPRIQEPAVENVVSLLTPYFAYLPADALHCSGVLAVVTAGIYISRRLGRIATAQVRLRVYAVWETTIFLLNGLVFILIGLQVSRIVRTSAPTGSMTRVLVVPVVIALVAIAARAAWVFPATYLPWRWSATVRARDPLPALSSILLIAWTQMRGVVSLAAALALPMVCSGGSTFPDRDKIIFITFGVILVTLVGQGLTLPPLIRALGISADTDETADEEVTARYLAAVAAVERLDALAPRDGQAAAVLQRLRATYDDQIAYYIRRMNPSGEDPLVACESGEQARREVIRAQREMVLRLRDQGTIGDQVLRDIERELDLEESQLA